MNPNRVQGGRTAKQQGHKFEALLAEHLGADYVVHGSPKTKIDIHGPRKISVKNSGSVGKNTQVSLSTQARFIEAMRLDKTCQDFIGQFFGGEKHASFPRHRKSWSDISTRCREHFLHTLNTSQERLFEFAITKGFEMSGEVDTIAWSTKKNELEDILYVDLKKMKKDFIRGEWIAKETTLHFMLDGKKLLHMQMKGSGKKYSNSYHGVQIHLYGNFKDTWRIEL